MYQVLVYSIHSTRTYNSILGEMGLDTGKVYGLDLDEAILRHVEVRGRR